MFLNITLSVFMGLPLKPTENYSQLKIICVQKSLTERVLSLPSGKLSCPCGIQLNVGLWFSTNLIQMLFLGVK